MKRLILTTMIFFIANNVFTQTGNHIEFDYNIFSYKDSIKNGISFNDVVKEIDKYCQTDAQKICLIAGWIYKNIDFDLDKLNNGGAVNDFEIIYNLKKGTCGDYSSLFSEFCNQLDIDNEIIEGYVPEYNSDNSKYYETNHVWNVVKLDDNWYHCDILGFSGYLRQDSLKKVSFVKKPNTNNILTQEIYFLANHIPADPMWQFSEYPIQLDSLLINGVYARNDSTEKPFNYIDSIAFYLSLTPEIRELKFADNAYNYNKNNHNVIVTIYFNAAIDLINKPESGISDLQTAKKYLLKVQKHIENTTIEVQSLKPEIERAINYINKYVP